MSVRIPEPSRIRFALVLALAIASFGVACELDDGWVCGDPESATRLPSGTYPFASKSTSARTREPNDGGVRGDLVIDDAAGTVTVTRQEGGKRIVERWRIVPRGVGEPRGLTGAEKKSQY